MSSHAFDISRLEQEYYHLQDEIELNQEELDNSMMRLYAEVGKAEIQYMIQQIQDAEVISSYSLEDVMQKMDILGEK